MSPWRSNKNEPIRVNRKSEEELKLAVSDLLDRGYEVIKSGNYYEQKRDYTYAQSTTRKGLNRRKFEGIDQYQRHYAILRKKPIELADSTGA